MKVQVKRKAGRSTPKTKSELLDQMRATFREHIEPRVQTGLRLDAPMFEQLRKSRRGVSDEIRHRVQRTFDEDSIDPVTRELRDGLVNLAGLLRLDFGEGWYSLPQAHAAFTAALVQRLARYKPPQLSPAPGGASDRIPPDVLQEPTIIGKLRETDDLRAHSYTHLAAVQAQRPAKVAGEKDQIDE
jgi:hypothetical protein